jgi:hypothetical protein
MGRQPGSRERLRAFFVDNVGVVLDSETLREVAGTSEWARRVRELRDEKGYDILTHNDLSALKPGQYLLKSLKPRPSFAREISKETRALVLDRNGFTCQVCGAAAGEQHPDYPDKRVRLHIGHVVDKSVGGTDDVTNLRAVCSICNEGAANVTLPRPDALKLKTQIRRASEDNQLDVLSWLVRKFPKQSHDMLSRVPDFATNENDSL